MSTIGSLAASWTAPASCSSQLGLYGLQTIIGSYIWDYKMVGPTETSECMPPSYTGATTDFYYPASVCPTGYTTGCQPTATTAVSDNSIVTQIAYTCCPENDYQSGFSCLNPEDITTSWPWLSTLGACTTSIASSFVTTVTSVDTDGSSSIVTTTATAGEFAGWGARAILLLAPEATASSSGPTTASSSGLTTAASSTQTSTPTLAASATSQPQNAHSSASGTALTTGAKAAIAVGVVVLAIAVGILVFFLCRRRSRHADTPPQMTDAQPFDGSGPVELGNGHAGRPYAALPEMADKYSQSLAVQQNSRELYGDRPEVLEADSTTHPRYELQ